MFALMCSLGCSDATSADGSLENEPVGETQQAYLEDCQSPDAVFCSQFKSGPLTVRLYQCVWETGTRPTASCGVGSDFALVGGGAEIDGSPSPGALLTDSYPFNSNIWVAKSKDHAYSNPHRLRAHSIGLRLDGLSGAQLRQIVKVQDGQLASATGTNPTASLPLPDPTNNVLLSGGGYVVYGSNNPGMLLTRSSPTSVTGPWVVTAKDHIYPNSGTVIPYLIYMPKCPPVVDYCVKSRMLSSVWSGTAGGYRTATSTVEAGYVPVGVGAIQSSSGNNRLLTDLYFGVDQPGSAIVTSKDHGISDAGRIQAVLMELKSVAK